MGDALVVFTGGPPRVVADERTPFTRRSRGARIMRASTAPLSFEKECPKRRRNALPRAGFMLEKRLIFPGDASPAPGSRAVAAEMLSPLTRVSGSKVQYSTTGGYDCYFPLWAIYPGRQLENARRASCHSCTQ